VHDTDHIGSNPSDAPTLASLIESAATRRAVLQGGVAAVAATFLGGLATAAPATAAPEPAGRPPSRPLLGFTAVAPSTDDAVHVPPGYVAEVLIPWGTPLVGGVAWQADGSNTAADQERQVGFNHDGIHYFPLDRGRRGSERGLLVLNHEYTDANQIYSAAQGSAITPDAAGRAKVAEALAGHGVTVVEIRRDRDGRWSHVVGSRYNRRITGTTPMAFSGPVRPTGTPRGTLNNCGNGITPWGTYLACEENWNGYFGTADPTFAPTPAEARYGVSAAGFGYSWHVAEPRFDLAVNRAELDNFGWIVEIDPFDPRSTPVKRTALGRFKHEAAYAREVQGRVVLYSGDDENRDYIYKFVGDAPWQHHRARRRSPLDHGTLHVARFAADGTGEWLPLVHGQGALTAANGWVDQADVLLRTRQAADAVGATPCHRPEWITGSDRTGEVYVTFTNGSGVGAPHNSNRDPNPYGHIVRLHESLRVSGQGTFTWDIFLLAGDPAYDPAVPADQELFGSPDGIWADPDGRVWIQTDISNSSQNLASRGYDNIGNNQMLAADPATGEVRRFLTGPRGCEVTGVITTPDQRTMFVNIQHPGESTTHWNGLNGAPSTANPRTVSNWPDHDPAGRPRSATVAIRRADGGVIGT
jgi:secreted PhoX family phosphatase